MTVCESDCRRKAEAGDPHLLRSQCWTQALLAPSDRNNVPPSACRDNMAFFQSPFGTVRTNGNGHAVGKGDALIKT